MPWTRRVLKAGASSAHAFKLRLDAWANALSGLGTTRDKTTSTLPYVEQVLSPQMLEVIYHTDDIAARIVSAVPDECFREPWTILNRGPNAKDDEEAGRLHEQAAELESDCARLGVRQKFREAQTWGRLYGLGAIFVSVDDGVDDLSLPLDPSKVRGVRALTVLDKRDLVPLYWYADPKQPKFGDVAVYQMQPVGVFLGMPYEYGATNQIIRVHETRLLRFGGELTSKRERLRNQGADYSILQKCFRALQLTNDNWQSVATLLADASQGAFKIKGLIDMIAQEPSVMQTRMALVDQMRSTVRGIVLDADGEEFTRVPTPFSGIPDVLEQTWKRLAAAARMPLTVLMGMSPAGLNATGESDIRWWYDTIAATQREQIQPNLERLLRLLAAARGYDDAQNWTVSFAPLWQMKPQERAQMELQAAQRDQIYLQEGVWLPEEVALARTKGKPWTDETEIDVDTRKKILELELARKEDEAENPPEPPPVVVAPKRTPGGYAAGAASEEQAQPDSPDPRPPGNVER